MHTHYKFFHLPHHKSQPLTVLTIAANLRSFLFAFFSLFLPIVIFQNYLYLGQQKALIVTLLFFVLLTLVYLLSTIPTTFLASKFGLKFTFLLAQIFLLIFFLLLTKKMIFFAFITFGFAASLWWYSYHLFFIEVSDKKQLGRQIGAVETVSVLSGVLAPFFGGLILESGGSSVFFLTGFILTLASLSVIFFLTPPTKIVSVSLEENFHEMVKRKKDMIAFFGAGGEETIYTIAWPIILYLIFKNILTIAKISTLIMLIAALVYYISGLIVDKLNKDKLERIGVWAVFLSWIGKAFFQNPIALTFFDTIHKVLGCFFVVPLTAIAYDHAKHEREKYIAFREISYRIGNLLAYASFFLILLCGLPLWTIFISGAFFALLPLIIKA